VPKKNIAIKLSVKIACGKRIWSSVLFIQGQRLKFLI